MARRLAEELRSTYESLLNETPQQRSLNFSANASKTASVGGSVALAESTSHALVGAGKIQQIIRPLYGKSGFGEPTIGDHPDFAHLKGSDQVEYAPITTMFMDIESSTRLSLLFDLPTVRRIKNTFILAAIEIVKAFDGHVHRIMGDSVMAYFGSSAGDPRNGAVDGLNCAAMLNYFVRSSVIPTLQQQNRDCDFGIRIGLDHAHKDDVLWSSYGYPGMCEVTATSLYVDLAKKLEQQAGRNKILIGNTLKELLDLPAELIEVPTCHRDGRQISDPFVVPNHTRQDGTPLNYRKWDFDGEKYLICSPLAPHAGDVFVPGPALRPIVLRATLHESRMQPKVTDYASCSRTTPKHFEIAFRIQPPDDVIYPARVRFAVENHGRDAKTRGGENSGNHDSAYDVANQLALGTLNHWESTEYTGLHYMTVEILNGDVVSHRGRFGVFIQ